MNRAGQAPDFRRQLPENWVSVDRASGNRMPAGYAIVQQQRLLLFGRRRPTTSELDRNFLILRLPEGISRIRVKLRSSSAWPPPSTTASRLDDYPEPYPDRHSSTFLRELVLLPRSVPADLRRDSLRLRPPQERGGLSPAPGNFYPETSHHSQEKPQLDPDLAQRNGSGAFAGVLLLVALGCVPVAAGASAAAGASDFASGTACGSGAGAVPLLQNAELFRQAT